MARIITFSRTYPSYHPRKGEPTYFVEKIWESIAYIDYIYNEQFPIPYEALNWDRNVLGCKHHTIRAGHRWKAGDWFKPCVWSGRPYHSKMIQFAPEIQIVKTWDFEIAGGAFFINDRCIIGETEGDHELLEMIAKNDGLSKNDLLYWFKYPKPTGPMQIICWNESIEY